jgi:hypothetical protein
MNQRINALAEQAHEYASNDPRANITVSYIEIFEKKFAELIVKECAQVASDYDGAHYVGTAIEKHFGVRE